MISWLQTKLAGQYGKFISSNKIIGVAGSFDQRMTALCCQAVLAPVGEIVSSSDYPLDQSSNLSKTILKIRPNVKKAILEFSSRRFGQMVKFLSLVKPEIGIIVGIDYSNAESVGNLEQIMEENSHFILSLSSSGAAILNWDDLSCRKLAEKSNAQVIFFGTDSKNCHLWAGNITHHNFKLSFELNYGVERVEISTNFIAKHQIYPLLAAAALGINQGLRLTQIKKGLESIVPIEHQLEVLAGFNGSLILDDSDENSPSRTESAIENLNYLSARRRILVLGEIKKLGSFSNKIHQQLASKIYQNKLDLVLLSKGQTKQTADELLKLGFIAGRMEVDLVNPQIVASLLKVLAKGDVVLVVGSKELRLDEVVGKITKSNS